MSCKTGIYKLINKITEDFYIGSASRIGKSSSLSGFYVRFDKHKRQLNNNSHYNRFLQRCWNKYGEKNFEFEILATCPPEYCIKLEQFFLDSFENKFNIRLVAESNFGLKASDETKQKMSKVRKGKAVRGYGFIVTEETKSKMSEAGKNKVFTDEHKQNLKLAAQKRSKELSQKYKGNNNPSAKLNWDKVDYIRTSEKSVKNLATELSVSITTIYKIKNNQIWLA